MGKIENKLPSLFIEGEIEVSSAQIRWCRIRCTTCNSIFTVTICKDDIPLATKCMENHKKENTLEIYSKKDLIRMGYISGKI
jgi:hypothetical protein